MPRHKRRRKPSPDGTCFFCGSYEKKLTAEHLFADWISWSFWPQRRPRQHTLWHRQPLTGAERRWKSAALDFKTPQVCDRCNNQTLSRLENEKIKPLLEPMMLNLHPTILTVDQQRAFAAWVVSRMIVFHHMWDSEPHFFTAAQRKQFIETLEPPEGVQVWIGAFMGASPTESGPIFGGYSGFDPDKRPEVADAQTYVLTFSLRRFAAQLLAVKGSRPDAPSVQKLLNHESKFVEWWTPRVVLPIWPPSTNGVSWPPEWLMGRGGYQQLMFRLGDYETPLWTDSNVRPLPQPDFFVKGPPVQRDTTGESPRPSHPPVVSLEVTVPSVVVTSVEVQRDSGIWLRLPDDVLATTRFESRLGAMSVAEVLKDTFMPHWQRLDMPHRIEVRLAGQWRVRVGSEQGSTPVVNVRALVRRRSQPSELSIRPCEKAAKRATATGLTPRRAAPVFFIPSTPRQ